MRKAAVIGTLLVLGFLVETPLWARDSDPRSTVLFDLDCASTLGRRHLTLFANGTVRLIAGLKGKETMRLGELDPDRLEGFRHRLDQVNLDGVNGEQRMDSPVTGHWVEKCALSVLRKKTVHHFHFNRYDTLPVAVEQLNFIAKDLAAQVPVEGGGRHLPVGYKPRMGDVLERVDGHRFEVVGFTSDGKGIELEGETDPITLYLTTAALRERFVALVSRRPADWP